jgi:hypothetical protein
MEKSGMIMKGILAAGISLLSLGFISAAPWSIQNTLNQWAQQGIFLYLLPFLLVFALIFAILTRTRLLGENKAAAAIIAAALGLMSLVGDYFPKFLERFAPDLSMGISVLLAVIILLGLFYDYTKAQGVRWIIYIFIGMGILIFLFIMGDTFGGGTYYAGNLWQDYGPALITLVIIGAIIGIIVWASKEKTTP